MKSHTIIILSLRIGNPGKECEEDIQVQKKNILFSLILVRIYNILI